MKNQIRVLQFFGEPLSSGGQESFVMNMYRNIDRKKIQFDFFTPYNCDNRNLYSEINNLGGKVYYKNKSFNSKLRKFNLILESQMFLKNNKYEIVHIHSGSIFNLAIISYLCRINNVKKIIVHSHATGNNTWKHSFSKKICGKIFKKNATDFYACSLDAAKWKFPDDIIYKKKYYIINNGIDTEKFKFNSFTRKRYRKKLDLSDDSMIITHIGRFTPEKNHRFIIEVYEKISEEYPNSKLLLIGDGYLRKQIEHLVIKKGLDKNVKFLGNRYDIPEILCASDKFIFPSTFEGLGISAIEAECSGLEVYCSKELPKELNITDLIIRLGLEESVEIWKNNIIKDSNFIQREKYCDIVKKSGFDAKSNAKLLENKYLNRDRGI